ncbi:MAG: tRNA (adenosine(37)-N6)-threonylcarbamoyltransferase complex ATPase subunit type 1 TsaE [Thermodesulfobacteriota bacterium]
MQINLPDPDSMLQLGTNLAKLLPAENPPSILLQGDLGAGKTTLVRAMVKSLPGGEEAEVSSPSFNLVNIYPTSPEVAHIDLYRSSFGELEDDILDYLFDPSHLAIIEWIEHIPKSMWPREYIHIVLDFCDAEQGHPEGELGEESPGRSATLSASCQKGCELLNRLMSSFRVLGC